MASHSLCQVYYGSLSDPAVDQDTRHAITVDFGRDGVTTLGQLFAKIFTLGTDPDTGQRMVVMLSVREWDQYTTPSGKPNQAGYMYASQAGGDETSGGKFMACCVKTLQENPRISPEKWRKSVLKAARPLFSPPPKEDAAEGCCVIL